MVTNVLLLDGESFFTPKVVRSLALAKRWRIHLLTRVGEGHRPALEWSRHLASFHAVAADGDAAYLREVTRIVQLTNSAVIMPVVESTTLFCIRHREALAKIARLMPLPTAAAFATAIDKKRLADFMAERGIPHPVTKAADDSALAGLRFPVLVKPRRERGGNGIVHIDTPAELPAEIARRDSISSVFIQEDVDGADIGCSVLARDGRIEAWTVQRGVCRPKPFAAFSEVQLEPCEPVLSVARRLIAALEWSGVANIDFKIDARNGQPLVLEVNGRYWATLLASTFSGVNFPDLACRLALDEPVAVLIARNGHFVRARELLRDLINLRPRRRRWTDAGLILRDPLPELVAALRRWSGGVKAFAPHPVASSLPPAA